MNFILLFYVLKLKIILYQATYTNSSENDWYLSKCTGVLQFVHRTPIDQFPRFLQLATRFSNFYRVSFDMTISVIRKIPDRSLDRQMLTLEIPQQSKRLVLQFYKCANSSFRDHGPSWINNSKNVSHNMELLL